MIDTPKISGLEFLQKLEPIITSDKKTYPNKASVFNALFEARGTDFSAKDFPNDKEADCVINLQATRAKIFISGYEKRKEQLQDVDALLIKPENKDYLLASLGAFLKSGGKKEDFKKELNTFKNMYEFKQEKGHLKSSKKPLILTPSSRMVG